MIATVKVNPRVSLGRRIRKLRMKRKLSQEALALASNLHRNVPGLLERGRQDPSLTTLVKIARGLKVSLSKLVEGL